MPNKLLLSLLVICSISVAAQKEFNPDKCRDHYTKPAQLSVHNATLPFSSVMIVDKRFDTSKLGYARPSSFETSIIKTKKSFAEEITEVIRKGAKEKFSGDANKKLLIVVRHFWLDGQPAIEGCKSACTASLDVYMKNGEQFSPLFKIDTMFTSSKALLRAENELMIKPFEYCIEKLENFQLEQTMAKRKKLSVEEILSFYQQQFNGINGKGDTLVKGVYLTFKDFLQNRPAYTEFRVANEDLADDIYIKQNGKEMLLSKFWGYCDGKDNYIKLGYSLFKLFRQNNTYDVYGAKEVEHRGIPHNYPQSASTPADVVGRALTFAVEQNQSDKLIMKAMQLNMETGKVY